MVDPARGDADDDVVAALAGMGGQARALLLGPQPSGREEAAAGVRLAQVVDVASASAASRFFSTMRTE